MYRDKALQDCLTGLVGFRQNLNPDYPDLAPSLTVSSSGMYFQDDHPLVCVEYLDQALKNYSAYNYADWSNLTTYIVGNKVKSTVDNKVYESTANANLNFEPSANPAKWIEVKLFSQKVDALVRSSISKVISTMFVQKKLDGITKSIFENVQIFDGAGSMLDKEIKTGRFVGFQIIVEDHRDLTTVLKRIGTQFTQANPGFKLYVFHSSQEAPIKVFDLVLAKANSFEWSKLIDANDDFFLRYLSDNYAPGGAFYIGYYETTLVGQAINRGYDFATVPAYCGSCNNNYRFYSAWSPYMRVIPMEVAAADIVGKLPADPGGPKLWDITKIGYQYTRNFGLNLDITVRCDVTDLICTEKHLFVQPILKQVTVDVLTELAYSTRNNVISKEVKAAAIHALSNGDNFTPGAQRRLEKIIGALSFDLSDLNDSCLPEGNKYGISWGAV